MKKLLFLSLLFWACQNDSAGDKTPAAASIPVVTLSCTTATDESTGNPMAEIFLEFGEQKMKIADAGITCEPIVPASYGDFQIPAEAVSACGGWWAGAGDYFYALVKDGKIVVYKGWQAEEQEDEGFHYEVLREVPLSR